MTKQEKIIQQYKEDPSFHRQMIDKSQQLLHYYFRLNSKENAQGYLNDLNFLMGIFENEKDTPEWYTFDNLKADQEKFNQLFK